MITNIEILGSSRCFLISNLKKLNFGKKRGFRGEPTPKKKLGVLKGKMITTIGFLGSNRCFLIPNLKKWKKIQNQGTKLTSLVFHKKSSTPNYHLRENPIVCHQLRENHLRENHASVSSTRKSPISTTSMASEKSRVRAVWCVTQLVLEGCWDPHQSGNDRD